MPSPGGTWSSLWQQARSWSASITVWRGLDYIVPITNEMVVTYKNYAGLRDRPGGTVMKGAIRTTCGASSRACSSSSSSSHPKSMEAAYGLWDYDAARREEQASSRTWFRAGDAQQEGGGDHTRHLVIEEDQVMVIHSGDEL